MIPMQNGNSTKFSRRARIGLTAAAIALLAPPLVYLYQVPGNSARAASAAPPTVEFLPQLTEPEQKIVAALDKPTHMDFHDTPLQDAVDYLKDLHAIEIQLESKSLEEAGVGSDTPVTRSLKEISLRSALRLMLAPLDLTFIIQDETLLLTTKDKAENKLITRTYPVGDLAEEDDYESLEQALVSAVRPDSWEENGGKGTMAVVKASKSLVISQTQDNHDQVLELLRSLRAARKVAHAASNPK